MPISSDRIPLITRSRMTCSFTSFRLCIVSPILKHLRLITSHHTYRRSLARLAHQQTLVASCLESFPLHQSFLRDYESLAHCLVLVGDWECNLWLQLDQHSSPVPISLF